MALRGLDHLVLGVRDMDQAGAFYEQLGFTVGVRNRHPWGTHNRIVQFSSVFLELVTVGEPDLIVEHRPGHFSFGAHVRDALAQAEGFSMLVLESTDAVADNAAFQASGIGHFEPFFFERQAKRPDGSTVRVAFTLAFSTNPYAPESSFFVCQQHEPQNFWNAAFQQHPNSAIGVSAVAMISVEPTDHCEFFRNFTGGALPASSVEGLTLVLPRGRIDVLKPGAAKRAYGVATTGTSLAGFTVQVADLGKVSKHLERATVPHSNYDSRVVVPQSAAFGTMLAFEQAQR